MRVVHHISAEGRAEWDFSEDKRLREMGIDPNLDQAELMLMFFDVGVERDDDDNEQDEDGQS